jgi:hypothetical protein
MATSLIQSTSDYDEYRTPMGILRVFKQDVKGDAGGKAGCSRLTPYTDMVLPKAMKLKKKYRG